MTDPAKILQKILLDVTENPNRPKGLSHDVQKKVDYLCSCLTNRAGLRLLMSCLLAKLHNPNIDVRKPYTGTGGEDSFSGRTYDEQYITHFINVNRLPLNNTTAYLTPAFRNGVVTLTKNLQLKGRPEEVYTYVLDLLDQVHNKEIAPEKLLADIVFGLLAMRDQKDKRMETLLATLRTADDALPLSSESIVTLVNQHLECKHSSRLPVLVVAAAYKVASQKIGEKACLLKGHNAADEQTGSFGDVEICLEGNDQVVTVYEMKNKRVSTGDIDHALEKIAKAKCRIHNYIFITTDGVKDEEREYAAAAYEKTDGTEIAILDCIGFLRHFLHLFHRVRVEFLKSYQEFVLAEPDSAVSQPLKEAFLALRQAAESDE